MANAVVHFELIGPDPALLRRFYADRAEQLGGTEVLPPQRNEGGGVVVGHFLDPAGNLVGVAGPV